MVAKTLSHAELEIKIIEVLSKVGSDTNFTLIDATDELKTFLKVEYSRDFSTSCYDEVWEHPEIIERNKVNKNPLEGFAFTLYRVNQEYQREEISEVFPQFKFFAGRTGNTTIFYLN